MKWKGNNEKYLRDKIVEQAERSFLKKTWKKGYHIMKFFFQFVSFEWARVISSMVTKVDDRLAAIGEEIDEVSIKIPDDFCT